MSNVKAVLCALWRHDWGPVEGHGAVAERTCKRCRRVHRLDLDAHPVDGRAHPEFGDGV